MRKHLIAITLVCAALAVGGLVVGYVYWSERTALWTQRHGYRTNRPVDHTWYPYAVPAVERPPVLAAAAAGLEEEEEVIGVEVGGKARAYRLAALEDRRRHVINDLVGGVPVSVTYCDLTDCVRVFTEPGGSAPLDIQLAGLFDGEMVVRLRGGLYIHKTGTPLGSGTGLDTRPYQLVTPARTTWKEWARSHSATDVYVGDERPSRAPQVPES